MAKKKQRGGKRKGAGRKPVHPEGITELVAVTVPTTLMALLDGIAEANGWNRSEAVTRAIRGLVATPKRG